MARADIDNEFYVVSEMVNLSELIEKLREYIGMITSMIKCLDKHDTEPNYDKLSTVSFKINCQKMYD